MWTIGKMFTYGDKITSLEDRVQKLEVAIKAIHRILGYEWSLDMKSDPKYPSLREVVAALLDMHDVKAVVTNSERAVKVISNK